MPRIAEKRTYTISEKNIRGHKVAWYGNEYEIPGKNIKRIQELFGKAYSKEEIKQILTYFSINFDREGIIEKAPFWMTKLADRGKAREEIFGKRTEFHSEKVKDILNSTDLLTNREKYFFIERVFEGKTYKELARDWEANTGKKLSVHRITQIFDITKNTIKHILTKKGEELKRELEIIKRRKLIKDRGARKK